MTATHTPVATDTAVVGSPVPHELPGLDRAWSRTVTVEVADGTERTFHLLDNGVEPVHGTVLCVHGNPTWSYVWRALLAAAPTGWRVVAPDHLSMGFSERTGSPRTLADRVADLGALTDALGIDGPVVTVGHDWGGIISLGWAVEHPDQLRGVVLTNTAVAQPPGDLGPPLIRLAHLPGVRPFGCVATPTFVRAAGLLSQPPLPADVRDALALPYDTPARRRAVGDFVADIPFDPGHPSYPTLARYAEGVKHLDVPTLMLWGPRDPVFGERYLADLRERVPHAQVHRFEGASHLLTEDAPQYADAVTAWLAELDQPRPEADPVRAVAVDPDRTAWSALEQRADDVSPAISAAGTTVSWHALSRRVRELAAGMAVAGVRRGDRVGLLLEPSTDLVSVVYAAWRAGAVVVVADQGLGFTGMRRALRGADLDHVVGGTKGLAAARAMGLPGSRIAATDLGALGAAARLLGVDHDLDELARLGRSAPAPVAPGPEDECAVVFTSGATGPAKGVVYRHRQLLAQVDLVRRTYGLGPGDRFVAAFAPFALLGPALGLGSVVPEIDVTSPDQLSAPLLAEAVASVDATVVFASPAALRRVVATLADLTGTQRSALGGVRLLLSAGAPVPLSLLEDVATVLPAASLRTPYGMTEAMPVTDVSLEQLREAGAGEGVCVGWPLEGVEVGLSRLDAPTGAAGPVADVEVTGEICVRAAHVKDRYDARWLTEHASSRYAGWHRTGDVGHLDDQGRLWVEGRLAHLVTTADGPLTPVGIEQRVETVTGVAAAAAVGVGPAGTQALIVVVVTDDAAPTRARPDGSMGLRLAPLLLADRAREVAAAPVSAVLVADRLPLDIRHGAKVDRAEVARQAALVLAGRRV